MSLGFDIGICKEALSQTGNVQAATEWYAVRLQAFRCNSLLTDVLCRILDRQGGQSKSPVLCLGQQPSNANPYVDNLETRGEARVTSRHDEQEAVRLREKSAKMALESKRAKRQDKEVRRSDAVLQQWLISSRRETKSFKKSKKIESTRSLFTERRMRLLNDAATKFWNPRRSKKKSRSKNGLIER